ncbi:MAG: addiction module protein [Flavisolibacter sp.]
MNIELEKRQIIEEIKDVHDEWLVKAIKRLLGLFDDEEIIDEHKQILDSRINAYEAGNGTTMDLESVKKRLSEKK